MNKFRKTYFKAVVLAAGTGSRLNEITRHIPKGMIRINGKYIFEIILENIAKSGIREVIFVVGYKRRQFVPLIQRASERLGINVTFITNTIYKKTNTMYSFWLAREYLDSAFIYLHGDLIFEGKMLAEFMASPSGNAILVDTKFPLDWDDAMKVISHGDGIKYMSKSITISEMDGIAIGIYKFDKLGAKKLLQIVDKLIKKRVDKSWVSEAINILAKDTKINLEKNTRYSWVDVDNLADLKMASNIYK